VAGIPKDFNKGAGMQTTEERKAKKTNNRKRDELLYVSLILT